MLSTGANKTLVANFLHGQNCHVTSCDIINMKCRIQFHGTPLEELQNVLQQPGVQHCITKDEHNILDCATFCTERQKKLSSLYGGVLLMEGTY